MTPLKFIHAFDMHAAPPDLRARIKLNLLDLIGIAAAGRQTRLAQIINDHATENFGGTLPMLFDGRHASAQGAALAAGMTIDSLDGHDGFNPAKGHIGCPMMPAALMLSHEANISGHDFLNSLIMGYKFGARAAMAQHGTVPDYHTSGSWGATAATAAGARLAKLTPDQTRHALGIAEYHGPRSQMMRCIDHPTMLKDGAGWGAMTGVAAVKLALSGFTGAPALTIEQAPEYTGRILARTGTCASNISNPIRCAAGPSHRLRPRSSFAKPITSNPRRLIKSKSLPSISLCA